MTPNQDIVEILKDESNMKGFKKQCKISPKYMIPENPAK